MTQLRKPEKVYSFANLHPSILGTMGVSQNATWPLNHFLYTLASFLMDGHRLKHLHLKLDISAEMDESKYGMILYPLRRLRNVAKVTIEGHVPRYVEKLLIYDLKSVEPAFNTMRYVHFYGSLLSQI